VSAGLESFGSDCNRTGFRNGVNLIQTVCWEWKPADMAQGYPLDFLERAVAQAGRARTRSAVAGSNVAKLIANVPQGCWKTMTFLAALRHDRIAALFVLDWPINGDTV
jgi:hypothetical protein